MKQLNKEETKEFFDKLDHEGMEECLGFLYERPTRMIGYSIAE